MVQTMKPLMVFLLALLLSPMASAGEIYRGRDANGVTVYSDQPIPGGEVIRLEGAPVSGEAPPQARIEAPNPVPAAVLPYDQLMILRPADQAVIEDPEGGIPLEFSVSPRLRLADGHRIRIDVDQGKGELFTTLNRFKLTGLQPGAHLVTVWVVDRQGRQVSPEARVKVFLRRP